MMTVTKQFEFSYAHMLRGHSGLCKRLHGHNGILEVEVGMSDYVFGRSDLLSDNMVIDFAELKSVVNHYVIDVLDHQYLNDILPDQMPPTAENIVKWAKVQLDRCPNDLSGRITRIRCYETPTSWAEWRKNP